MTEEQNLLNRFVAEYKSTLNFYLKTVNIILTIPLIVNAGAAIALAGFFTNKNSLTTIQIKLASIFFILGTIFGLLTLIYEFFASYFTFNNILRFDRDIAQNPTELVSKLKTYYADDHTKLRKIRNTVLLRITNGAISLFFCFLGIYFVATYILGNYCYLTTIAILLLIYCIVSIFWMKSQF